MVDGSRRPSTFDKCASRPRTYAAVFSLSSTGEEGRREEGIGIWSLELLWDLDLGAWIFPQFAARKF